LGEPEMKNTRVARALMNALWRSLQSIGFNVTSIIVTTDEEAYVMVEGDLA